MDRSSARTSRRRCRAPHRPRVTEQLRRAFFAQTADVAGRYGIRFDEVVVHLWRARRTVGRIDLERIGHLDDLVHVVACHCRVGGAWQDLCDRYEPPLVRRCTARLGPIDALLVVRGVLGRLRHERSSGPSFESYIGDRSIRTWLMERVHECLAPDQDADAPRTFDPEAVAETAGRDLDLVQAPGPLPACLAPVPRPARRRVTESLGGA